MVNKELKQQYINDDTTNKNLSSFMPRFFETIGKYEDEYQKDLCNFTIQEIKNYFLGLSTSSNLRIQNIKSQFIKYSRYCQDRGLIDDNQIHWLEVDSDFIDSVINLGKYREELVTRKQLLKDMEMIPNASEQFIMLGIFEGVCGNMYTDFYHLDIKQFHKKGDKIILKLKDRDIQVSNKLYELALESAETYQRIPHAIDYKRTVKLADEPWVVKRAILSTVDTEATNMHYIANRIASIKKDYDLPYCTQSGLMNSGRIDYLISLSKDKEVVVETIRDNYNDITERYGRIQKIAEIITQYKELYRKGN